MKTIIAYHTSEWLLPNVIAALSLLCSIQGATGMNRSLRFSFAPATPYNYTVLEGDNVDLICETVDSSRVEIVSIKMDLVRDGKLLPYLLTNDNISSRKNETTFVLSLHNITRNSSDYFSCKRPIQNLILEVLHRPSREYPLVTSYDYKPQYFCDNEQHGPLQVNCTTETGNPPVDLFLYIEKEGGEQPLSHRDDYTVTRSDNFIHLSFVKYLNSSFNDARLVCSISQQLPALYENYNKSRFVDISPPVSLHIHPSHYILSKEGEVTTLTCSSNVSGFVLEWIDIPLADNQYNISSVNDSIKLVIFDYGSIDDGSIIVQCRGSCGGSVLSQEATIKLKNESLDDGKNENKEKRAFPLILSIPSALVILMITTIISFVFICLVLQYKSKSHSKSKTGGVNKSNENIVSSSLLTERELLRYPDSENRGNLNGEENVNEPIDEKEKTEEDQNLSTTDNVSQHNSNTDMIDNPNYEPFKSKIDSEINGMDEGYATVC